MGRLKRLHTGRGNQLGQNQQQRRHTSSMLLRRHNRTATNSPCTMRTGSRKTKRARHELAIQRRPINAHNFYFFFLFSLSISALVIIGIITVASPSIIMRLAFSLIFPHETASLGLAPLRLPSHSSAVVM